MSVIKTNRIRTPPVHIATPPRPSTNPLSVDAVYERMSDLFIFGIHFTFCDPGYVYQCVCMYVCIVTIQAMYSYLCACVYRFDRAPTQYVRIFVVLTVGRSLDHFCYITNRS